MQCGQEGQLPTLAVVKFEVQEGNEVNAVKLKQTAYLLTANIIIKYD